MTTDSLWAKARALGPRGLARMLVVRGRRLFGLSTGLKSADRLLLENVIIRQVAGDASLRRVLMVGCDWYTAHYPSLLPDSTLVTIDPDPRRARFGAPTHHVARLEEIDRYAPEQAFDVVICNGVYGWGLDRPADCERAFDMVRQRLRIGGLLVLGWNDVPAHDPAPLVSIDSLRRLTPCRFAPLDTERLLVQGSVDRHTFAFYRRDA